MDANFSASLLFTLKEEGGFSNDPHDPGGATYKGITLTEYRIFRGDPDITVDQLKAITDGEVSALYYNNYWVPCLGPSMPDGLDCSLFDMGVNAGPPRSLKLMQAALGVTQDGIVGPHTLAAIGALPITTLLMRMETAQAAFYRSLSTFQYFGKGWIARTYARYSQAVALLPNPMPMGKAVV